ncbi:MAG: NfeD family protein [Magnetococcales bacterium]|nr:NfeD family protein [Magnetococcales bacterium]
MEAWLDPLNHLDHWHWAIAAVVLILLEVMLPAVFFLWLGLAAAATALLHYLAPGLGWKTEVLVFSFLSLAFVGVWHGVLKRHPTVTDRPTLNRRGSQYIGRVFTLEAPMVNGRGKVRVDDSSWLIAGEEDQAAGTRVRVVGAEGVLLRVERVEENN